MKLIFTVINTSWAVLKIRPEKIFMPVQHGIWMHDLCNTGFFSFFRPYFHYCSGSVHYRKDHFNSCLYPQFTYMIFTVIYSSLNRFIWNQHNDQLPVGLLAQLVKSHTGLTFFQTLFSLLLRQCSLLQRSPSHSSLYPQFTYMIFIYSQSRNLVLGQANNFF